MSNTELSFFLKNLANSIDKNELDNEQLKSISEFYIRSKFESTLKDRKEEFSEDDMKKFLTLGWHIYVNVLKNT